MKLKNQFLFEILYSWFLQGWCSGKGTSLPPMWSEFDSQTRRHMWVEFVVLYSAPRSFSPGTPVFPSPQKPTSDLIYINC